MKKRVYKAILPDGSTQEVVKRENSGQEVFLKVSDGWAYDRCDLKMVGREYLEDKIKELLRDYSPDEIASVVEGIQEEELLESLKGTINDCPDYTEWNKCCKGVEVS